ncbi:MAG: MBL fold metallo-hydrolase [Hymenobacteraceae bacterium]|nr:MBL fold metallo-hydrolase [Hymenobacteraceae bacterium]
MKQPFRLLLFTLTTILLLTAVAGCSFMRISPQFGAAANGARLEKIKQSPHYRDGQFQNPVETKMGLGFQGYVKLISTRLSGPKEDQEPNHPLPVWNTDTKKLHTRQDTATVITWLGHSAFLVEMDGKRLLLDPMMGERASPLSFMGPKRFSELPFTVEELPQIDAVLISHDHYDHLDYGSIQGMAEKVSHFFVPLGVGAHLERWGVPGEKITELDWWQEAVFQGLTLAATPSRHFSGRGFSDRMQTLWTSWVIQGRENRIFFSGDTGYFEGLKEIGEKYGPFDITLLECGQYNEELWPSIHMLPEQTVQAHTDLKGKVLMPIHWGAFALAMHNWIDPIERVTAEAKKRQINIATPYIGEPIILGQKISKRNWWRE